jgi:hypothetical protein
MLQMPSTRSNRPSIKGEDQEKVCFFAWKHLEGGGCKMGGRWTTRGSANPPMIGGATPFGGLLLHSFQFGCLLVGPLESFE